MKDIHYPTYDEIHEGLNNIAKDIRSDYGDITDLVCIARGGVLPGLILSHMLNTKMHVIHYSSQTGNGDNKNHGTDIKVYTPKGDHMLIVDDILDTGHTMRDVHDHYVRMYDQAQASVNVIMACIHWKPSSVITPNYYVARITDESKWVYYPFDSD